MPQLFRVSSKSNANSVAGALAAYLKEHEECQIDTVGAGALNQAVKAIIIARGFLVVQGIDVVCVPSFEEIAIDGETRTAIALHVRRVTNSH